MTCVRTHAYDVRLTSAEAVVLFELLHRIQDEANVPLDAAERGVTASLLNLLEGALTERADLGYADVVARAKRRFVVAAS